MNKTLDQLAQGQSGIVARRQLNALGIDADRVRDQIAAGRWVERTPRVISTVTGHLTFDQQCWVGVLHAGPRAMLGNLTAAKHHDLEKWDRPEICVLVDDELSFEPVDGVDFFRSRRPFERLLSPRPGIPRCRLEPAVLLWAAYEAPNRAAHAVLAATVQQRLTTATRLIDWVDQLRPLRRAKPFKRTLSFVDAGAHSGAELEVGRMCRRFAMPPPSRQRRRTDRWGRPRWTDAEWDLADGRTIVLEVEGGFHMDVLEATADARRARRLTTRTRTVVRCTAYELIHETSEVAVDLVVLGVPGRLPPGRVPVDAA